MAQFHAAYLLEPVQQILTEGAMAEQALALIRQLGVYERDSKDSRPLIEANQLAAVASNIISRAIPTRPSPWMQQVLLSAYANKPNWSAWVKTDNPDKELLREQLFNALHIIDPRITQESQAQDFQSDWDRFGEEHAEEFLYHLVPAFLGSPFLQLLERDVPIQEFLHYAPQPQKGLNKYLHGKPAGQIDSDVLFSMQFPYALDNSQGLIFEVRDIRKEALEQRHIDGLRDEALSLAGYSAVYRYRTTDFANIKHKFKELKPLTDSDYFIRISNNFNTPLYQSPDGLAAMELVLLPVLAARIQKTLLEFVHKGLLSLEDDTWHIGVIERDLPAALLATEDLRQLLAHLMRLKGGGQHMPTIKLSVFHTAEFKDTPVTEKLHHTATEIQHKRLGISQFSEFTRFDLLLDVSILMRRSVKVPAYKHNAKLFATIRSAHSTRSRRKFRLAPRLHYKVADEAAKESLHALLQHVFKKTSFLPGQQEVLQKALRQENTFGLLPPHGGKSLVVQMATLLQPGLSVVVVPSSHLALDQELDQKARGIDIATRHSIASQQPHERRQAEQLCRERETLLLYSYSGNFQNKRFRSRFRAIASAIKYFGYSFIDEAHSLSEWSHDFRSPYFFLNENLRQFLATKEGHAVPVIALASVASYQAMVDVQHLLHIAPENRVEAPANAAHVRYHVHTVKHNDIYFNTTAPKAYELISQKKQIQLTTLLNRWYGEHKKAADVGKTLIICPEVKGPLGLVNQQGEYLSHKLKKLLPHLTVFEFFGTNESGQLQVDELSGRISLRNIQRIRSAQADIILATEELGIGINTPGIRQLVYLNMPASVERFIQINGRALRQNRESRIHLLFNNQPIQAPGNQPTGATQSLAAANTQLTTDKWLNHKKFEWQFSSPEKEKQVLSELLNEITFPEEKPIDLIAEAIAAEFGIQAELSAQPANNPYQLFFTSANKSLGYIDFRSYTNVTEHATHPEDLCERVLNFAKREIERLAPEGLNVFNWLKQPSNQQQLPGIKSLLAKVANTEVASLAIHFRNNGLGQLTQWVNTHYARQFTESQIREWYYQVEDSEGLMAHLGAISNESEVSPQDIAAGVRARYRQIREFRDTMAAMRRLATVGVIQDFTIDHHARLIRMELTPKKPEAYRQNLQNHLSGYLTPNFAQQAVDDIRHEHHNDQLEAALHFLVDFTYDTILPWHLSKQERMEQVALLDTEPARQKGEQTSRMAQYLTYHAQKPYANPFLAPNLLNDTDQLTTQAYKTVLKYIKEMGQFKANWHYLEASSNYLLRQAPTNYVLLFLNAFAELLLHSTDNKQFYKAYDKLVKGAITMYKEDHLNYQDFITKLNIILKKLYDFDSQLQDAVEPLLNLKIHLEWLVNFNQHFLNTYKDKV